MPKKASKTSSASQMDINKMFLEAITKLKKSEVSISQIRAYILKHYDIDILNKLKDLKMQTGNRNAAVLSQNSMKGSVSTMSIKEKTEVLKTTGLLKQSKLQGNAKPNDKTKRGNGVVKAGQKKRDLKEKVIATVLSQNSKKGVVSTGPSKAKTVDLKNVKLIKKQSKLNNKAKSNDKTKAKKEVGTSNKNEKSSVVKVSIGKNRIKSKVPEDMLILVPETIPGDNMDVVEDHDGTSSNGKGYSTVKVEEFPKEKFKSKVPEDMLILVPETIPRDIMDVVEDHDGTSSNGKGYSVVKVEELPKEKIKSKVPEEMLFSVPEIIPEDEMYGVENNVGTSTNEVLEEMLITGPGTISEVDQKSINENSEGTDIDFQEVQQENDVEMQVE